MPVIEPARGRHWRAGSLEIDMETFRIMLGLPDKCTITNVGINKAKAGTIGITVVSPNLPEIPEGGYLPKVTLNQIRGYDE